jgi:cytosine/uracil/thiamine/allantoin permease
MNCQNSKLNNTKCIGIGLSFILFPLIFVFAFAGHPNLLNPHFLAPAELIQRAHNDSLLHFGHALVTLCAGFLIVVALHFMNILKNTTNEWYGFIGGVLAILGTLILAVDKGALCLTMSALDTLPEDEFVKMMHGLLSMFGKEGWLI